MSNTETKPLQLIKTTITTTNATSHSWWVSSTQPGPRLVKVSESAYRLYRPA